jgi:hypothetical protein
MALDRKRADEQALADFLVADALGDERKHFDLARGQNIARVRRTSTRSERLLRTLCETLRAQSIGGRKRGLECLPRRSLATERDEDLAEPQPGGRRLVRCPCEIEPIDRVFEIPSGFVEMFFGGFRLRAQLADCRAHQRCPGPRDEISAFPKGCARHLDVAELKLRPY